MATLHVSNESELMKALSNATGTTTISMAAGNYDGLYISGNKIPQMSNNSTVTFTSADANNPATITNLILIGAKNVVFDGIDFDYTAASGANVSTRPYMILSSDNVTVKNSTFDGDLARGGHHTENGFGTGIALGVQDSNNVTVQNNTFTDFHKAVVIERGVNFNVSGNDISQMSSDGINFNSAKNVVIADNHLHDFASHPNTSAHKDMIQIWSIGKDTPSSNVTITGNVLNSGTGTFTQSILIKAENNLTHTDLLIENNLIHNSFTHGIALDDIKGLVVQNNTVLHNVDSGVNMSGQYVPKIIVGGAIKNAIVKDNVAHAITGSNWTGSGNLIVQNTSPNQANYYGDLFVNALVGGTAVVADLAPLPGGTIIQSGIGATLGQVSNALSSGGPTAFLLSQEGNELAKGTVDFDISNITDNGSSLNTNGAKVVWDFGDGTTGSGLTPSHHYTHAGSYQVKATVTLKDGTKITSSKQLNVDTPIILASDFESGAGDQSDLVNAVSTKGSVKFVNDQGSKVVKLGDNGAITYTRSPELFDNTAYTLLADFRKDNPSDDGKIISFANSFVVQVKNNSMSVSVTTDKGTKWIHTSANVDDANWHKMALTFSSTGGTAELYLDGQNIATLTGLKGAVQVGNKRHDFHVGSNTGGAFDGLVDNVSFLSGDLSASQIKSLHDGSTTVPNLLGSVLNTVSPGNQTQTPAPVTDTTTPTPTTDTSGSSGNNTDTGTTTPTTPTTSGGNTNTNTNTTGSSPAAIAADFQGGIKDISAVSNASSKKGAVTIVTDQGSKVAKLGDKGVITFKDTPDLFGNKAYTVMADFRKDNWNDDGKLISFADSFVIQVKKNMMSVSVTTDQGTKWIHTSAKVNDTNWHKVALTFDSGSGKAQLFLDGKVIGSISGLKGAIQVGDKSHDFHVGSPWGGSFDGLVDNVAFLTNDLSASEIKSIHSSGTSLAGVIDTGSSGSNSTTSGSQVTHVSPPTDTGGTSSGSFSYTMTAKNTKVVLDSNASKGIVDQAYLSGDTASAFNVKVIDTKSAANFNNSLGVYEIDGKGNIVDVRIIDKDAQTGNGTVKVTGVEKGHDLGFFIVQDGYNRLDNALGGKNLSLEVQRGNIVLKDGNKLLSKKVFVSHDKDLNYDNHQHVTSMDNPNNTGAILTFEDQHKGGARNDLTDVVFEVTAVGADELSFA